MMKEMQPVENLYEWVGVVEPPSLGTDFMTLELPWAQITAVENDFPSK